MLQKLPFLYRFLSKALCGFLPAAIACCKMRTVTVAIAIALLAVAVPLHAKGKRQQQDAPKAEDQAKKKAAEEAYKNALKSIPTSNEKSDPWKTMR
ncbi:MAG TPA: hypothetical protein VHT68_26425 [Pseudolabrys sp.]|jgi:hypothetical protein|nr:hypothetical protein [Pseudolabrys sp.]